MKIGTLIELEAEKSNPCLTISLNTNRTHPDNLQDIILLKNLCKEAEERLIEEFGKRTINSLLEKLEKIPDSIDLSNNLDSMQIFLSNDTQKIVKSIWQIRSNNIHISDSFDIRNLIKDYNRSEDYFILLLSHSGVHLFEALYDNIVEEIINDDFPIHENFHSSTVHRDNLSDPKKADNMAREFFLKVDTAVMEVHNKTELFFVVICTEDNYSFLMEVTKYPNVYRGYANIDYHDTTNHKIGAQAWEIIWDHQTKMRRDAISEMKEAVSEGKVFTDLQEIYSAAKEGRGDL